MKNYRLALPAGNILTSQVKMIYPFNFDDIHNPAKYLVCIANPIFECIRSPITNRQPRYTRTYS